MNSADAFFRELEERNRATRVFSANYKRPRLLDDAAKPAGLLELVRVERSSLSESARRLADALDQPECLLGSAESLESLRWKLEAFEAIQDSFDVPLFCDSDSIETGGRQWFFYYESRYVLSEAFRCGLEGCLAATLMLARLFVEFNVWQNYYYYRCRQERRYQSVQDYLANGRGPSWGTALRKSMPRSTLSKAVRARVKAHLDALSDRAAHPYHPRESWRRDLAPGAVHTLEGVYFWATMGAILEAVLWMYYVNFPTLFFPRDLLRKFGFSPPLGLIVDEWVSFTVRKSLLVSEYARFSEFARESGDIHSLDVWLESIPDLDDDAILATWDTSRHGSLQVEPGTGMWGVLAEARALRQFMALPPREPLLSCDEGEPGSLDGISTLEWWSAVSRRAKQK